MSVICSVNDRVYETIIARMNDMCEYTWPIIARMNNMCEYTRPIYTIMYTIHKSVHYTP